MAANNLFYFPYASLTDTQLPLMKVAALYFDKLIILDPVRASWNTVGADAGAREAVQMLRDAGILELVAPADALADAADAIEAAVRRDMADEEFLALCDSESARTMKRVWTLSLAKVPTSLRSDDAMRFLMGSLARDIAHKTAYAARDYIEHIEAINRLPGNDRGVPLGIIERERVYDSYREEGQAYDEYREGYGGTVEYRYADLPLALGESIMMNHALFTGLVHAEATPLTDDPFHSKILRYKLTQASRIPEIAVVIEAQTRVRQLKSHQLAAALISDTQLDLPILRPEFPLAEVLQYRLDNDDALSLARDKIAWMARQIESEPWSDGFSREIETKTIPAVATQLESVRTARDGWLKGGRGRLALSATGIAAGAAVAVLSIVAAPLAPIALATAGLGLVSGSAVPGAQWLLDWREQKVSQQNGLHYFLAT